MSADSNAAGDVRIDLAALWGALLRRLPRIIIVTLLLLAATFVILSLMPRLYESSAAILVEPRANIYSRSVGEAAPASSSNEAGVVSSQIELLKSRDTLLNVVDQLNLRSNPEFNGTKSGFSPLGMVMQMLGRASRPDNVDETVLNTLYSRLSVVQERDSRIITVLVRSEDPQLAADIANAVANAHVARRASLALSDTAETSTWLGDEIERLRGSVRDAEAAVAEFRVDNNLLPTANNPSLIDQQLSTIAGQIAAAQERKSAALSRATLIRGLLERGQPIDGVADVRDSVIIQQLNQEKARLQGEQAQRSATLLPNHPTIRALDAQIAELDSQIVTEGRRVADALDAEAQIEADLEASLQGDLERLRGSASTATVDTVTLDGLEREAAAQRNLLESYLANYSEASSRLDPNSALPDVRVVSIAAPSVAPVSPQSSLMLAAVGIVSVVLQVGIVLLGELLSGRALKPVPYDRYPGDALETAPFDINELEPDQRWEGMDAPKKPKAEHTAEDDLAAALTREDRVQSDVIPVEAAPAQSEAPAVIAVVSDPVVVPDTTLDFIHALASEPIRRDSGPDDEDVADQVAAMLADNASEIVATKPAVPAIRYAELVEDLAFGRTHLLVLADPGRSGASERMAVQMVQDARERGQSIVVIDGGSGRIGERPGLTDLSAGTASFGEVVLKSADNGSAQVPWGQGDAVLRGSTKPVTLVEALGDIYEVVVVLTGRIGKGSTLPIFAELPGRLVLVAGNEGDLESAAAMRRQLIDAGLAKVEIASFLDAVAA